MSLNHVVKIVAAGTAQVVDTPIPQLPADDYVLVKTTAVAINPTDWKHVENAEYFGCVGSQVGCDYAGIVEEVGRGVTKNFQKGDRICGPVNGSNSLREVDGSFAKYIVVKGDLQIRIPIGVSDEEAATLGVAVTTIGQALYQTLKLPLPTAAAKTGKHIFVNGGSTAMGIFGIQYAKLSGFTVSATSSPHNFNYLKSLGADAVFDYKSPTVSADVRAYTNNELSLAWDCQSTEESVILVGNAISTEGGVISTLLPVSEEVLQRINPKARMEMTLYYSVFGEPFSFLAPYEAVPEDYEFGRRFWEMSSNLFEQGKLRPIRVIKNRGGSGLEGVLVGLEELKKGKVSAGKLVYTL
ncbi:zinc-binding oxidoreductase [Colletotrichum tofieldiae]|uniref:Zinc-binding oxidoreductase n=1 Tax=Colletotrichum tofieldiae TaxID=708197 RepID=A0A166RUQ1_9PEZI|nr:zinc-binding oxidoreductase [Colletotrichum tofieldiae]